MDPSPYYEPRKHSDKEVVSPYKSKIRVDTKKAKLRAKILQRQVAPKKSVSFLQKVRDPIISGLKSILRRCSCAAEASDKQLAS